MSGFFANTKDDDCFIVSRVNQSVGPYNFQMFPGQWKNCEPCFPLYGATPDGRWYQSNDPDLVDKETILKNQSYPYVGCGRDKVRLLNSNEKNKDLKGFCNKWITPQESLMTHPKSYYRELQIDRFYDLQRPQESFVSWDYQINSKQQAKDAFVQKFPVPLSFNPSIPPSQRTPKNNF